MVDAKRRGIYPGISGRMEHISGKKNCPPKETLTAS